jgi:hypothetical protein
MRRNCESQDIYDERVSVDHSSKWKDTVILGNERRGSRPCSDNGHEILHQSAASTIDPSLDAMQYTRDKRMLSGKAYRQSVTEC